MQRLGPALAISALAVLVAAPSAFAAVTAADVWAQWQDYAARAGQTATVDSESASGDTLTLSGVTFAGEVESGESRVTLDSITLHENGDGTVLIQLPAATLVEVTTRGDDETVNVSLQVGQEGLEVIASGEPGAISYDYTASRITMELAGIESSSDDVPEVSGSATLEGVEGSYRFGSGEPQPVEATTRAGRLTFSLDAKAEENSTVVSLRGEMNALDASSTTQMPARSESPDLPDLLRAGMTVAAGMNYGTTSFELAASSEDGDLMMSGASDGGNMGVQLSPAMLRWNMGARGQRMQASGSVLPLPRIETSLEESAFGMAMPLAKSDTPQDIALLLRLVGLTLDDGVWALIDHAGQIPRGPLTLILDLAGTGTPKVDMLDEAMQEDFSSPDELPIELHTLALNELEATAAGASLTGHGAFTFDNSDLETWDGFPAPEGAMDLKLVGVTQLLGTLTSLRLVPEDQAMMAQMMLGMFTKPGEEPDSVTTKIEVTKDGGILANGQRLQ